MVSPNNPSDSGSKRKLATEAGGLIVRKAARVGSGNVPSFQGDARCCLSGFTRPSLSESCFNYLNSGVPHRIMIYNQGCWQNFQTSVTHTLVNAFKDDKASVRFNIGNESFLFDFLSMAVVNLRTRKQKSIAWIDEADKCFFPTVFGHEDDDCDEWDIGTMDNQLQVAEVGRPLVSQPEVVKHVIEESGATSIDRPPTIVETLFTNLDNLARGSRSFLFARDLFLSGMGPFASPHNIVAIHRYVPKDATGKNRLKSFETQIRVTAEERGDANVRYGWFGAGKSDLAGVLFHGFAMMCGKATKEGPSGTALYLTQESRSFASVKLCDIDEKGVQYMILCRVILGNTEQVNLGSKQCFPSNGEYDSGVDDCSSPKCYMVWPTHLRTYVHPEYLVSFKLPPNTREYFFGLRDVWFHVAKRPTISDYSTTHPVIPEPAGPTSLWLPFTVLLQEIQDKVSPVVMELLLLHHQELKNKIISRHELAKKMKDMVGKQILVAAILKLKQDPSSWSAGHVTKKPKGAAILTPKLEDGDAGKIEINYSAAPSEPNGPANRPP